jgi:hypothetical protein
MHVLFVPYLFLQVQTMNVCTRMVHVTVHKGFSLARTCMTLVLLPSVLYVAYCCFREQRQHKLAQSALQYLISAILSHWFVLRAANVNTSKFQIFFVQAHNDSAFRPYQQVITCTCM